MHRMLLSKPDRPLEVIKQIHDIALWQKIVGGAIAIVPLTTEGLAAVVNRQPPVKIRQSIMIPLQEHKKYNMWGAYFFVKYHQGELVDLTDSDIFAIKGLLGDPIPIQLSVDLAAALGFKPLCQYEGCGFMKEHPAHKEYTPVAGKCVDIDGSIWHKEGEECQDCGYGLTEGIRPHEFVKPESIEVETVSEVEAAKLMELQQSGTAAKSPTSAADPH